MKNRITLQVLKVRKRSCQQFGCANLMSQRSRNDDNSVQLKDKFAEMIDNLGQLIDKFSMRIAER